MAQTPRTDKSPSDPERPVHPAGTDDRAAEEHGARVRRRNKIISIVFGILFFALLIWMVRSGGLADTDKIQKAIEKAGFFGPILFILISICTSYIPIIPMGSMGAIGIAVFGELPAFWYNSVTSILNCLLAYLLVKKYGNRIILTIASPETVEKYENLLKKSKHYELIFAVCMFLPVSPDLLLCMIAGLMNMKFSHFLVIILLSRPFSSWCYNTLLLKAFQWLAHTFGS